MKAKLCLHGVDIKHQAQLVGLVKRELAEYKLSYKVSYKVKEKYFDDNDMYKCRLTRFVPKQPHADLCVICMWGVLLVSDKPVNVADIVLEYEAGSSMTAGRVLTFINRLLEGKQCFVLEEPDLSRRIDLLRGRYFLDKLPAYDETTAMTALQCHVPWHLYSINKLWEQLLLGGGLQKTVWRQLRVKLRRLRSVLSMVKPLFGEANVWKLALKQQADALSSVREYDVLLQTCGRMGLRQAKAEQAVSLSQQQARPVVQSTMEPGAGAVPQLQQLLQGLRQQAQARALQQLQLNELSYELARMLVALQQAAGEKCELGLHEFFSKRLGGWALKLVQLQDKYGDIRDMEQLHRVRIKLKRFRYALQSVPELNASPKLLRSLKYLQDMLGLVHDDYVNEQYLRQLVSAHPELPELRYEVALLRGWEQAKADAALDQLAGQWQEFERLLGEWLEELE